jgi:hypothetical protein
MFDRDLSVVIPGRRDSAEPGIQTHTPRLELDSGFASHSASKTRVNALMARAPE